MRIISFKYIYIYFITNRLRKLFPKLGEKKKHVLNNEVDLNIHRLWPDLS